MAKADTGGSIVPDNAPDPPENVILKHYAWGPMWVENSNALFTVVGDPGDGKSWASLRMAEVIDPTFNIDRVAFDIIEFLHLVMDDSIGQGQVIVLEEGEVEASAYDWHSKSNKVFRTILDTWRHQNRMAIINLPSFAALDKGARRRTDAIVEMMEAKPWKDYSQAKFKVASFGNIEDNFTTPFKTLEGKKRKFIRFRPPSEKLREQYEVRKEEFTSGLNQGLLEELVEDTQEGDSDDKDPENIVNDILEKGTEEQYISTYNGREYVKHELIEADYDIGGRRSKTVKSLLERELGLDE